MRKSLPLLALLSALMNPLAQAKTVTIIAFPYAELTELQSADGSYYLVSDVKGIRTPLSARLGSSLELTFVVGGVRYSVARADVELEGEALVVDACKTVPVVLAADSRSASTKGAGEGC